MSGVSWIDIAVDDAAGLRDFYASVVGWTPQSLSMGDYDDFGMNDSSGETVAGICHAKGPNASLPPMWIPYFQVADLEGSLARCLELGGELLRPLQDMGSYGRLCIIRDPAGAVCALSEPPS